MVWTGLEGSPAAFVVIGMIGSAIYRDALLPETPSEDYLDSLMRLADNPVAQAGACLELFSALACLVFIGYVGWRLRAAGWVAAAAVAGGVVAEAVHWTLLAPVVTLNTLRTEVSPENARVLAEVNVSGFMVHMLPLGLFILSTAIAGSSS
jgi:hypothetical protein